MHLKKKKKTLQEKGGVSLPFHPFYLYTPLAIYTLPLKKQPFNFKNLAHLKIHCLFQNCFDPLGNARQLKGPVVVLVMRTNIYIVLCNEEQKNNKSSFKKICNSPRKGIPSRFKEHCNWINQTHWKFAISERDATKFIKEHLALTKHCIYFAKSDQKDWEPWKYKICGWEYVWECG